MLVITELFLIGFVRISSYSLMRLEIVGSNILKRVRLEPIKLNTTDLKELISMLGFIEAVKDMLILV